MVDRLRKEIKELVVSGKLEKAKDRLTAYLEENVKDDEAYYLLGNICRKQADWKNAIHYYLSAVEINPDSPAGEAHRAVMEILNFSNPDLYNP